MATKGLEIRHKALLSREWDFPVIYERSSSQYQLRDIRKLLSQYDRFVPVIGRRKDSFFKKRQELFDMGLYPGVEYLIKDIFIAPVPTNLTITNMDCAKSLPDMSQVIFGEESIAGNSNASVFLLVRPAYPLIQVLEREWPVLVALDRIPFCLSRGAYNTLTVATSISLALSVLLVAWTASQLVSFSVVNTRSMAPAILPKDVILVEKVSPPLKRLFGAPVARSGQVIFFKEPPRMHALIEERGLPEVGDALLVKRVAGYEAARAGGGGGRGGGGERCVSVQGDNERVSLDSRQFGCFSEELVVGTPLLRIFPPNRVGTIGPLAVP